MGKRETRVTNGAMLRFGEKGIVVWKNPRGFDHEKKIKYGVGPNGASDLIGFESVIITPDMVGQKIARFIAPESKSGIDGVVSQDQKDFQALVIGAGGKAPVIRFPDDVDIYF